MSKKQILGLIGSGILLVGVFTPLVSLPFLGTVNYFANGKGDGTIVLGLAVISLILVLIKKYKGLLLTGLASLAMVAYTFINLQTRMASVKEQMQKSLEGNPFAGLGDLALQSVQMQWGWAVLIIGAILLLISATIGDYPEHNQKNLLSDNVNLENGKFMSHLEKSTKKDGTKTDWITMLVLLSVVPIIFLVVILMGG